MTRVIVGLLIACGGSGCVSARRGPANVPGTMQKVRIKETPFAFAHRGVYYKSTARGCVLHNVLPYENPLEVELTPSQKGQLAREDRLEQFGPDVRYPCPKINLIDTLTLGHYLPLVIAADVTREDATCVYAWGPDRMICTFDPPTDWR